ncbi:MAG TPA: hypothetical protein VGP07_10620 [Polyangia bacterium]|jgi:hypothetical protein
MIDYERLLAVKKAAQERLFGIPGVHAVGIGAKLVAGKRTPDVSIAVFVLKKRPPGELSPEQAIPAEIEGFKTDVIEQPPPRRLAGTLPDKQRYPSLRGGIAIKPAGPLGGGGTLGCLARTNDTPPRIVALTCWHVVADPNFIVSALKVQEHGDVATFSGTNTPATLVVVELTLSPGARSAGAYYVTSATDDLDHIATNVAKAITDLGLTGITASANGADVTTNVPAGAGSVSFHVYGPRRGDLKAKLHATVTNPTDLEHVLTLTGRQVDGQALYTTIHPGGARRSFGVFVAPGKNLAIGGIVTKLVAEITAAVTQLGLTGITASPGTGTVKLTGVEAVTCEITSDVRVGQPDNRFGCSTSWCTNHRFGRIVDGRSDVDVALIEVDPGLKYLAEIEEIGVVKGFYDVKDAEAHEGNEYPVKKRGMTTGLTNGTILHLHVDGFIPADDDSPFGSLYQDAMHVASGLDVFADSGDSGSALVSDEPPNDGMVVGIIFGAGFILGAPFAMATPIKAVVDALHISPETATDAEAGVERTVPQPAGSAMSLLDEELALGPVSMAGRPSAALRDRLNVVGQEVSASPVGQQVATAVQRHIPEVQDLINDHRRVGAVWRRNGGTQIIQGFLAMVQAPERPLTLPATINARPVGECLRRIHKVMLRYGSAAFGADLSRLGPLLLAHCALTYPEMLAALRAAGTVH